MQGPGSANLDSQQVDTRPDLGWNQVDRVGPVAIQTLVRQNTVESANGRHSPLQAETEDIMHQHVMAAGSAFL